MAYNSVDSSEGGVGRDMGSYALSRPDMIYYEYILSGQDCGYKPGFVGFAM